MIDLAIYAMLRQSSWALLGAWAYFTTIVAP